MFKDFKIKDLFDIHTGKDLGMINLVNGPYNVVSNSLSNNGISATTQFIDGRHLFDYKKCIAIIDIGGFGAKVQTQDFYVTARVKVVELKNTIGVNKHVLLYFATLIDKYRLMFDSYSSNATNKLKDLFLSVPITPDGIPDYAYMEEYIKGIQSQYIDNLLETNEAERNRLLSIVGLSLDEYESVKGNIELSEATSYGEFKVGDLFEITNGGRVTKQDQVEGTIPYVTATTENNGIESYISNPKFTKTDLITVSFFGDTYYHPYEIGFKDGTYGLELLGKKSKYIYLYLTSVLHKRFKGQGSYSQMLTGNAMSEMFIQLPVTSTGEVDYEYMEDYISKIKLIYIYIIGNYLLTNK